MNPSLFYCDRDNTTVKNKSICNSGIGSVVADMVVVNFRPGWWPVFRSVSECSFFYVGLHFSSKNIIAITYVNNITFIAIKCNEKLVAFCKLLLIICFSALFHSLKRLFLCSISVLRDFFHLSMKIPSFAGSSSGCPEVFFASNAATILKSARNCVTFSSISSGLMPLSIIPFR